MVVVAVVSVVGAVLLLMGGSFFAVLYCKKKQPGHVDPGTVNSGCVTLCLDLRDLGELGALSRDDLAMHTLMSRLSREGYYYDVILSCFLLYLL